MTMSVLEEGLGDDEPWDPRAQTVQAHYSSITLHRKCPSAWYFRYGLGLNRPILGPAPYLHFGLWYGLWRSAESLERGREFGSLLFDPRELQPFDDGPRFRMDTLTTGDVEAAAQAWWDWRTRGDAGEAENEAWLGTLGEPLPKRLSEVTRRWRDEFGEAARNEEPLGVEVFWRRDLPRPASDLPEPGDVEWEALPRVVLIGFIDELYRDRNRGMIVVRDDKTTTRMENMSAFTDMTDSQLSLYAWGVTPALKSLGAEAPRAMGFDRILSKVTAKPSLNMDGTLSKKSWVWDLRTYLDFVASRPEYPGRAKDGSGAGVYELEQEVVQRLKQEQWKQQFIQRTMMPITQAMIVTHLRAAVDTVTDIWRTQRRAATTFDAARNLTKDGCRWCDYAALCRARMFNGTGPEVTYDLREYGLVGRNGERLIGDQTYTIGGP